MKTSSDQIKTWGPSWLSWKSITSAVVGTAVVTLSGQGAEARTTTTSTTTTMPIVTTTTVPSVPVSSTPNVSRLSSTVSANPLSAGQLQTVKAVFGSSTNLSNLIVEIRIYNSANTLIASQNYSNIGIAAGGSIALQYAFQSSSSLPAGNYNIQLGVWSGDWVLSYLYETVSPFSVISGGSVATTPTTQVSSVPAALLPSYISVQDNGNNFLQTGTGSSTAWVNDGIWGAGNLVPGTYTGINGQTYEQANGVSPNLGPNGEIAWRSTWKWPSGTTEVKSYPSAINGNKPGCSNTWITPCGNNVKLPDGSFSQVYPSGPTPNTFFPLQLPVPPVYSSFNYEHNSTPTGSGHLSYDIWLQNTPVQQHGWNAANEITHEIMIPLNYWGNYGAHQGGRNPGWYSHDATIAGYLFHVYYVAKGTGPFPWNFIVFEPDSATAIAPGTLDLSEFINYVAAQGWAAGNEYLVSTELGIEEVDGTGDLTVFNYRVWK